jgi:beta-mannosidase
LHEQSIDVASISADTSSELTEISWEIAGQVEKHFHVQLSLLDANGKDLSQNQYMLLIGDQADARKRMKAMGQEQAESNKAFTYGNYYRFFPDMIQQNDKDWQSQTQTPRANLFSPERSKERRHDED